MCVPGVAMMELVSMHLKAEGSYISRSLSYHKCEFSTVDDAVSTEAIAMYDAAAILWQEIYAELMEALDQGRLEFPIRPEKDDNGNYIEAEGNFSANILVTLVF